MRRFLGYIIVFLVTIVVIGLIAILIVEPPPPQKPLLFLLPFGLIAIFSILGLAAAKIMLSHPTRYANEIQTAAIKSEAFFHAALNYLRARNSSLTWTVGFLFVGILLFNVFVIVAPIPGPNAILLGLVSIVLPISVYWRGLSEARQTRKKLRELEFMQMPQRLTCLYEIAVPRRDEYLGAVILKRISEALRLPD